MTGRRLWALDAARGLAVVAMVVFHLIWDLGHFGYIPAAVPWSPPVKAFGHTIAFSFLFIAGASLVLANRVGFRRRAFWRRFAIVAGAAALVSVATYIVFPDAFVFFGILHCIAAASLLSVPLLFAPWPAALAAGVAFFTLPHVFTSDVCNADWLQWVGLSTREPLTQDWRPLFPWAGAMFFGVGAAKLFPPPLWGTEGGHEISESARDPLPTRGRGALPFLGRHSLLIYLAHQPALFALFTALVMVAPPPEDPTAFILECEASCRADGASKAFCHDACVCTAQEALRTKALVGVTDEAERGKRLREIAGRCVAKGRE
jgi:uncharacterized membrane protein